MATRLAIAAGLTIAIGAVLLLTTRKPTVTPGTWKSTDDFIQWLASQAVADAETQNHVHLDYSVDSIKTVDKILGQVHDAYAKDPNSVSVRGLGSAYGAYVGEVIRRSEPGARWDRDDPVAGEKSYPLVWGAGHSYPLGWCQKRILFGDEESVWVKYSVLKDRSPEKALPGQVVPVKTK
jgi:hypothetical protein